ncbi:MAG: triose-phosphate isomerase [Candidatus Diapherotrites archaeon]
MFFLNFKTYEEGTGKKALKLAEFAEQASNESGKKIILVVQSADLRLITEKIKLDVFAQHIDPIVFGSNTGKILPEAVKQAGAKGTIINHAENKVSDEFIEKAIMRAKESGLKTMACAESIERAKKIAEFRPDLIAIEPPELIGGAVSVSKAKPEIISDAVKEIHSINLIPVIAGAGINSFEDVKKSIELGAKGVFVASAVVKSKNPKEKLLELIKGL